MEILDVLKGICTVEGIHIEKEKFIETLNKYKANEIQLEDERLKLSFFRFDDESYDCDFIEKENGKNKLLYSFENTDIEKMLNAISVLFNIKFY